MIGKSSEHGKKRAYAEAAGGTGAVVAAANGPRLFTAAERSMNNAVNDLHAKRMGRVGQAWGLNEHGGAVNEPAYRAARPGQPGYQQSTAEERSANSAARKRKFQVVQEANRKRNASLNRISHATGSGPRKVAMATGFLAGVPLAWHGFRSVAGSDDVRKRLSQSDIDAGFAGGAAGAGGYQLAMYATKPVDRFFDRKLKTQMSQEASNKPGSLRPATAAIREHEIASGFENGRPPQGDPRWLSYNRNYPKSLPGARWRRAMSRAHGGKTGVALTTAMGAAGAVGGVAHARRANVKKSSDVLQMPSWYQVGIPMARSQSDPISPLAMYASSRIMVDNGAALLGRKLNRRERNQATQHAYQFIGARGLAYSPLGMLG